MYWILKMLEHEHFDLDLRIRKMLNKQLMKFLQSRRSLIRSVVKFCFWPLAHAPLVVFFAIFLC